MFAFIALPPLRLFAAVCPKPTFLGLKPWYQYLTVTQNSVTHACTVTNFDSSPLGSGGNSPFLLIGLAILDDLLRIAAMVAVGYVIYGGIQYITSQGSPDATKKAQQTIINALIGVVIAVTAAGIVAFAGAKLGNP
ncbi:MAG TPA: hypothetical protein VLE99_00575 [Candidatus Saccharimonadales bacterium]|nr:hypothetical protein [Candidatus Saccharimonadales bacterium]